MNTRNPVIISALAIGFLGLLLGCAPETYRTYYIKIAIENATPHDAQVLINESYYSDQFDLPSLEPIDIASGEIHTVLYEFTVGSYSFIRYWFSKSTRAQFVLEATFEDVEGNVAYSNLWIDVADEEYVHAFRFDDVDFPTFLSQDEYDRLYAEWNNPIDPAGLKPGGTYSTPYRLHNNSDTGERYYYLNLSWDRENRIAVLKDYLVRAGILDTYGILTLFREENYGPYGSLHI